MPAAGTIIERGLFVGTRGKSGLTKLTTVGDDLIGLQREAPPGLGSPALSKLTSLPMDLPTSIPGPRPPTGAELARSASSVGGQATRSSSRTPLRDTSAADRAFFGETLEETAARSTAPGTRTQGPSVTGPTREQPVGGGPSLPSNTTPKTATNAATNTADAFSMFARRAAMGAAIGGGTQAAWGLGPGDFSAGHIVGGAAGGAVLGMAGGYGASRARSAGYMSGISNKSGFFRMGGKRMPGMQLGGSIGPTGLTYSRRNLAKGGKFAPGGGMGSVSWGRAGLYTGATMGSFAGAWAGGNMFGNSRRRKSMGTLSHYGELF